MDKGSFQNKIGNRIRQLREMKNISQIELAHLCDFEKSNMNRIEAGKTNPTAYTLYKICTALNITLLEFFSFESLEN